MTKHRTEVCFCRTVTVIDPLESSKVHEISLVQVPYDMHSRVASLGMVVLAADVCGEAGAPYSRADINRIAAITTQLHLEERGKFHERW